MQDRVPTPGKENRVRIRTDDGQTIEGVLEYADEPIVQGSAYNKANVLPDDVCDMLGIPTTSEPKDAFIAKTWYEYERITSSKKFIVPDGVYHIGVFAQGGGQSGSVYASEGRSWGGAAGYVNCAIIDVTPGQQIWITIGSGGTPVKVIRESTISLVRGNPGGDTKIGEYLIAWGGGSINANDYKSGLDNSEPSRGYTIPTLPTKSGQKAKSGLYMFPQTEAFSIIPQEAYNIFDPNMLIGSAGGSIGWSSSSSTLYVNSPTPCDLGVGGIAVTSKTGTVVTGGSATGNGCGGGAACLQDGDRGDTVKSGAGAPGIVIIYV